MIIENEKRKMAAQAGSGFGDSGSNSDADPGSGSSKGSHMYRKVPRARSMQQKQFKRQWTFICGPIMPGDTVKMQGRQEECVSAASGEPEHITQVVCHGCSRNIFIIPKESMKTGPYTASLYFWAS